MYLDQLYYSVLCIRLCISFGAMVQKGSNKGKHKDNNKGAAAHMCEIFSVCDTLCCFQEVNDVLQRVSGESQPVPLWRTASTDNVDTDDKENVFLIFTFTLNLKVSFMLFSLQLSSLSCCIARAWDSKEKLFFTQIFLSQLLFRTPEIKQTVRNNFSP